LTIERSPSQSYPPAVEKEGARNRG
jgi:hypothetical protein